jgi:hypothetical protein
MKQNTLLISGFALFGFLIGYITGITSSEISQTILTALFAFMGGKVFLDFQEENKQKNRTAGAILLFFSLLFFIGLNIGVYIKVNKLLTKTEMIENKEDYLRNFHISNNIEAKYRRGEITCDSLVKLIFKENEK